MAERRSTNAALRALQAQEAAWRAEDEERARRYVDLSKIKVRNTDSLLLGVNVPRGGRRDLNVRVKPQTQISAPRISTPDRALMALERFSPALGSVAREADDFLGIRDLYRSGIRFAADALGGDVYAGNEDLQYDDRQNLLLNAALTVAGAPLAEGAGAVGRRALNAVPAGVRQGASDLAARGVSWLRENAPLLSRGVSAPLRDVDYVEGVFRDLPEEMGAFAVQPAAANERLARAREQGYNVELPLYHGSSSDFDVFAPDRSIFLTDRPDIADIYAFERAKDKTRKYGPRNINSDPNVRPVYARMTNPLIISDQGPDGSHGWSTDNLAAALGVDPADKSKMRGRALYDEALRQGYDLVKIENMLDLGGEQSQYVPLKPEYVKSWFDRFDGQGAPKARGGLAVKRKKRKAR